MTFSKNVPGASGGLPVPLGVSPCHKSAFGLQGAPRAPVRPAGQTGLQAGLACRPDWPAGQTGLQARLNTPASYLHPTTKQKSNYVTKIQLLNRNPTTSLSL